MNSKKELWILLASFVLPIAFGSAFFYLSPGSFTKSTVNYGEFVNPIISTADRDVIFRQPSNGTLQGVWTLTYVTESCQQSCRKTLEDMNKIRILTNENMRRIQSLLLISGPVKDLNANVLLAQGSQKLAAQLKAFPDNHLFLIDPLGNVMLHYNPEGLSIKRVLKDLKRLFKYSRIG